MKRAKLNKLYRETRELIAKPNRWCQGNFHVFTTDGEKFCLVGALREKIAIEDGNLTLSAHSIIRECIIKHFPKRGAISGASLVEFNDHRLTKHKDVLKVLDCAIADTAPKGTS